jgi:2-polyprenyl-3-methyl-5-hydroxy-6-metoxy-1,4-benzoquinol methylase
MNKIIKNFETWNEEMAKKYNPDKYHNSRNCLIRWIEGQRVNKIIKLLEAAENDKILELGCGAGNILEKIEKGELFGADLSDFMLELARKKLKNKAKLFKENIESLSSDFKALKFNKIYCSEVLEHLSCPERAIEQIIEVSHPQALIIISVPNEPLINRIKGFLQRLHIFSYLFPGISKKMDDEWHLSSFNLALLRKLTDYNFKELRVLAAPFIWLPLHYIVLYRLKNNKQEGL